MSWHLWHVNVGGSIPPIPVIFCLPPGSDPPTPCFSPILCLPLCPDLLNFLCCYFGLCPATFPCPAQNLCFLVDNVYSDLFASCVTEIWASLKDAASAVVPRGHCSSPQAPQPLCQKEELFFCIPTISLVLLFHPGLKSLLNLVSLLVAGALLSQLLTVITRLIH